MSKQRVICFRPYQNEDFVAINELNKQQGWDNLVEKQQDTQQAWGNSTIAEIAEVDGKVIGCLRGLTDGFITLYVCELLVAHSHRKLGIGKELMRHVHNQYPKTRIELLASSTSRSFYETQQYRPFYGFRKTIPE